MKLIKPGVEFIDLIDREKILTKIEVAGRTCYKSEANITPESASKFVSNLVKRNHWAMIEHGGTISVRALCDRAVAMEIVRHRLAGYAMESTRYVKYGTAGKDNDDICFIAPEWCMLPSGYYNCNANKDILYRADRYDGSSLPIFGDAERLFIQAMIDSEQSYNSLVKAGQTAQQARAVLPNALKTEIIITMNLREWKHFIDLRSKGITGAPHPDIKIIADMIYEQFHKELPEIFV